MNMMKRIKALSAGLNQKIMSTHRWMLRVFLFVIIVLLLVLPYIPNTVYYQRIIIMTCIFSILALSLNLVTGFAGQLSFCHIAFFGIGAYTGALLMLNLNMTFWLAVLVSAFVTALFGLLLGLPTLRLRGDYLAIVTLGFGEIVNLVLKNWISFTGGSLGLRKIPSPVLFGYRFSVMDSAPYYYLVFVFLILTIVFLKRLTVSGIGLSMLTVKHDEIAAEAIGVNPVKYKLMAFVLSAGIAGAIGTFFASYSTTISPGAFVYNDSVTILAMVVLGGLGSIVGSLIGAFILTVMPEILRFISDYRMVIYGALMVVMMIFRPQGFWGMQKRKYNVYVEMAEDKCRDQNS